MLEQRASADDVFYALGAPSRRVIVDQLSRGPASVSELAEPLEMTLDRRAGSVELLEALAKELESHD